ncbi:MAG: hypothetical protein KJO76_07505 [Gammaproteobacteria bacterium]|nr:hypothetical protein [Gammaproteobacteria bacterium]
MHSSTRFTLTSTVLLGILLYAVLRFADGLMEDARKLEEAERQEQGTAQENEVREDTPVAAATETAEQDPYLPRVESYDDLVTLLDKSGLNGLLVVEDAARWYAERGYLGENPLLGVTSDNSRDAFYATFDKPTLRAMSDAGDAGASQALARMAMFDDPLAALALYEKAVSQGSVYALIKVADTLNILVDLRLMPGVGGQDFINRVMRVRPGNLNAEAYATLLAAMSDGGPPIIDEELLNWGSSLEERTDSRLLEYACKRSAEILIANSMARQQNGVTPVSMTPPPVFLSPPDREQRMPCAATGYPVVSMMNIDQCQSQRVVAGMGDEQDLYICQP